MFRNTSTRNSIGILAGFVSIIAACSSTLTGPAADRVAATRTQLQGAWTFVRGCGGIAGGCTGGANEPTRYLFRDDSVEAFRNGQRVFVDRYVIAPGAADSTEGDIRPSLLIGLGPTVDPRPLRISFVGDSALVLDEGCCDRFAFEYRRER